MVTNGSLAGRRNVKLKSRCRIRACTIASRRAICGTSAVAVARRPADASPPIVRARAVRVNDTGRRETGGFGAIRHLPVELSYGIRISPGGMPAMGSNPPSAILAPSVVTVRK